LHPRRTQFDRRKPRGVDDDKVVAQAMHLGEAQFHRNSKDCVCVEANSAYRHGAIVTAPVSVHRISRLASVNARLTFGS
jgi:hypothetical protein